MKTTLTIEESARLIELGVDAKLASYEQYEDTGRISCEIELPPEKRPIFGLTDILSILPKEIDGYHLSIEASSQGYEVSYMLWDIGDDAYHFMGATERPELIDALYQLAIWCLENGHLNTKAK